MMNKRLRRPPGQDSVLRDKGLSWQPRRWAGETRSRGGRVQYRVVLAAQRYKAL